jgi:hypothetical protein
MVKKLLGVPKALRGSAVPERRERSFFSLLVKMGRRDRRCLKISV